MHLARRRTILRPKLRVQLRPPTTSDPCTALFGMEFILSQLQPSPMTLAIVISTISILWWIDQGAVLRGFVADPCSVFRVPPSSEPCRV